MTLLDFCKTLTNDATINITEGNRVVASFLRSTYESIISDYTGATVASWSINAATSGVKSIDITVIKSTTP